MQQLSIRAVNGTVHCSFCRHHFNPICDIEQHAHELRHLNFEMATEHFLQLPPDAETCRQKTLEGRQQIRQATTAEECLAGAELVVEAWFYSSLTAAISGGYWREHPEPEVFSGLAAERIMRVMPFGGELFASKYGCPPSPFRAIGQSWMPG